MFTLTDGSVQMGVVAYKSKKEVVVRDSTQAGKEVRILANSIQREQALDLIFIVNGSFFKFDLNLDVPVQSHDRFSELERSAF